MGGIKTEGPIRIDVANASRLRNRLKYSVMWVALDEEGNEIPLDAQPHRERCSPLGLSTLLKTCHRPVRSHGNIVQAQSV